MEKKKNFDIFVGIQRFELPNVDLCQRLSKSSECLVAWLCHHRPVKNFSLVTSSLPSDTWAAAMYTGTVIRGGKKIREMSFLPTLSMYYNLSPLYTLYSNFSKIQPEISLAEFWKNIDGKEKNIPSFVRVGKILKKEVEIFSSPRIFINHTGVIEPLVWAMGGEKILKKNLNTGDFLVIYNQKEVVYEYKIL